MKRIALPLLLAAVLVVPAAGRDFFIEIRANYFAPSDPLFKDIYGSGWMFGGEAAIRVWGDLAVWMGGSLFERRGELTFTKERTIVQIFPIGVGLKYMIPVAGADVYAGAGVSYCHFSEENPIGNVDKASPGYMGKLGAIIPVSRGLVLDVYLDYSYCRMQPVDIKINVGGLHAGIGLGYEF